MSFGCAEISSSAQRANPDGKLKARSLRMTEEDMAKIAALERGGREINPKGLAPNWD